MRSQTQFPEQISNAGGLSSSATPTRNMETEAPAALPFSRFVWGAGIECSFLPHLGVDQFAWTQHNRYWRDDLRRAKDELGVSHLRYAFPWHTLEPQRGRFDWSFADERMEEFDRLGIELILDVMHFGTPLWLKQAAGDVEFPESLEEFTAAVVDRYRSSVSAWCPCNEPLVLALFSGDFGFWPPHSRKWRGYMPVLSRIVQAVNRSIRAIRRTMPEATVVLCDTAENYKTRHESLALEVRRRNLRRFLVLDLLTGRVDRHHGLHPWLTAYGMSDIDLEWFANNPQRPDVLGLDYYPHGDWQLDLVHGAIRQNRADRPVGLYGVGSAYYQRYGIPIMLTETSAEGQQINREIWLEATVEDTRRLREAGVPMLGYFWWPMIDQVDWDGALTHRIGKIHQVGLYNLQRQQDGTLARIVTPLAKMYRQIIASGEQQVGPLEKVAYPSTELEDQAPAVGVEPTAMAMASNATLIEVPAADGNASAGGNGNGGATATARQADAVPGMAAEPAAASAAELTSGRAGRAAVEVRDTNRYGIVVFSHLRWGFVWQRPQQFLSRFARKHSILFIEEPVFDLPEGLEPSLSTHRVMPNVTVAAPHCPPSLNRSPELPGLLRKFAREAIDFMNEEGEFDRPLLWYYSPMDSAWSLGHFENRGIVFDSMDELSQFSGAPKSLVDNERRLMEYADIVFTGGYELYDKKRQRHDNVHCFGCGVEIEHFGKARDGATVIPADIDFMARPILGWFGVVDERVDYGLLAEISRLRQDWSIAMVGPVVKVDPNLLPHSPNLFFLGARQYEQLPNYCKAFDVCIMPFAINAATEYINPTKGLEYMATGRPIISTPVRDVVRQWSDIVYIARTPMEFVQMASKAMHEPDPDRIRRGLELAEANGWDSTVRKMQDLIAQAIKKDDRRSNRQITPLPDTEVAYNFAHTPGS